MSTIAPLLLTLALQAQAPAGPPADAPQSAAAPAAEAGGNSTLRSAFKDLPHALARVGGWRNLAFIAAGGGAAAAVHPQDFDLTADAARSPTVDRLTEGGSIVGGGYVQIGGAAALWLAGATTSHPALGALGADLLEAQAVNGILTTTLKYTVQRRRPNGGRYSFPSGHTSTTFATAAVLENHYGLKVGIPAYALGAYVAASRLHDRKHFASDTLMGAGIGLVAGRVTRHSANGRVSAAIVPLGRGVAIAGAVAWPR